MPERKPRIAARAWIALAAMLLLFVAVTAYAWQGLAAVTGQLDEVARVDSQQQRCAEQTREHLDQLAAGTRDIVRENGATPMRALSDRLVAESVAHDNDEATLGARVVGGTGRGVRRLTRRQARRLPSSGLAAHAAPHSTLKRSHP